MRFWLSVRPTLGWEAVARLLAASARPWCCCCCRARMAARGTLPEFHYQPVAGRPSASAPTSRRRAARWRGGRSAAWPASRGASIWWLAGGFCALYAVYLLAGVHLADLGWERRIFEMCDAAGGVTMLTTGLVLLAAGAGGASSTAWRGLPTARSLSASGGCCCSPTWGRRTTAGRGGFGGLADVSRGFFAVAVFLWGAALVSGRLSAGQVVETRRRACVLWSMHILPRLGFPARFSARPARQRRWACC